jgi:hypothetical protein
VQFAASFVNDTADADTIFRINIDGTPYDSCNVTEVSGGNGLIATLLQEISGLSAGFHAVAIEWAVVSGTASSDPVGSNQNANLVVWEVSV